MPVSRGEDCEGLLPEMLNVHVRPSEANDWAFPRCWEVEFSKGASNRSEVGVLVERCLHLVMLVKLADATAVSSLEGFTFKMRCIFKLMHQKLRY